MGYQARWGPKGFIISTSKIVAIENLTTSFELKQNANNDTSGTPPTNTEGMELQPVTISTRYLRAAGVDPRGQIEEWRAQVGNAYPLYLAGQLFGPPKLQLQKVDVSDMKLDNKGNILACTVNLSFKEYSPTSTTNASSSAKKTASTGTFAASMEKAKANAAALTAKPTTADKATKKTSYTAGTRRPR